MEVVLKRMWPERLAKILNIGRGAVLAGLSVCALSVAVFVFLNADRYGGASEKEMVSAVVNDVEKVEWTESQYGAETTQERWYLTAECMVAGTPRVIRLDEYFLDKSYAFEYIGEERRVCVDTSTLGTLQARPVNFLPLAGCMAGFWIAAFGALVQFRYTDYRRRILPLWGSFGIAPVFAR